MVQEKIDYPIPVMEKYLERYIWNNSLPGTGDVLSQELAGFTKGEADSLRKAMGKKKTIHHG